MHRRRIGETANISIRRRPVADHLAFGLMVITGFNQVAWLAGGNNLLD
jgi:hypothetical protein